MGDIVNDCQPNRRNSKKQVRDLNATRCACLRVKYAPEELPDGMMRERWICVTCGVEFKKKMKGETI